MPKRYYTPPKTIDPRRFNVSRFTLTVFELHRKGMCVTRIAETMGVDKESVIRAVTDVWEMDNPKATVCESNVTIGQVLRDELREP